MQNRQIDKKKSKQARIDGELHHVLKIRAARARMTIKALLDGYIADGLRKDGEEYKVWH